jgi:carbon-monoxide dehydrogenase large subunit
MKRKEDPRFIRGKGNYVDDVKLPGMLYMDIVRSPYAHAKIKKIDTSKALKIPGVLAVIDGPTLEKYKLHWMPTISADTQMVLPTDEVMYQAQEVCAVIATERYIAADGADAVEVDYEPLPVTVDPLKSIAPGRAGAAQGQEGQEGQPGLPLGGGRQGRHRARARGCRRGGGAIRLRAAHPRRLDGDLRLRRRLQPGRGQAHGLHDHAGAARGAHGVSRWSRGHVGLSEERIRIVSPDIGGGFGGKVPVYPGYVIAVAASVVIGKPMKWIEDRMENLQADSFARDYHMKVELGAKKDGTMTALRIKTIADHGYTNASANPMKFPAGLFSICTGLLRPQARVLRGRRGATRTSRPAASPTAARSASPRRRTPSSASPMSSRTS